METESQPPDSTLPTPTPASSTPASEPPPPPSQPRTPAASAAPPKRENLWINLLCNAVFPAVILTTMSKEHRLGPMWALIVAISLPLGYGIYDLISRRKWNVFSILGVVSTALTGGLGLFKLSGFWFAVKEAAVPLVLGAALPISQRAGQPLVKLLVCNDQILDMPRVMAALDAAQAHRAFDRLLAQVGWIIAGSFVLSSCLNFGLALWILKSPPGTSEFGEELGRLTALSYPVITLPCMVVMFFGMWKLLTGLEKLTGLKGEDLFHSHRKTS
ncbi:MAG: VC0807 family protein [Limisphaerales bacterium]